MLNFSTNNSNNSNLVFLSWKPFTMKAFKFTLVKLGVGATFWDESATAPPFQMPVELLAEASSKRNFYMRFHWWQSVLLECDSNLANSCCVIEKRLIFWEVFCKFSPFPFTFLQVVRKTNYIDTINNSPQRFQ